MIRFTLRRLAWAVVTLLGVTAVATALVNLTGDPVGAMLGGGVATPADVARLRASLGLDDPWLLQYIDFLRNAAVGDFGISFRFRQDSLSLVLERFPATLTLAGAALLFALVFGIPLGIVSAVKPNSWMDKVAQLISALSVSLPLFWIGIVAIMIFAVQLRLLPVGGNVHWTSIILPATTLGLYPLGRVVRTLRSSLTETLGEEYVITARAKGLRESAVIVRHALRNAWLPVITVMGVQFGILLGGAIVTETIFAWPGIGQLSVQAALARDYPLVRSLVTLSALGFLIINLIVDLLYAVLDPRVRAH